MKLNIFRIPASEVDPLKNRLVNAKMSVIHEVQQHEWVGRFYYSVDPAPTSIPWAEPFSSYFPSGERPTNRNHFAAFVFERGAECFVLSYGKSHFYIRPYCDHDFGIELAKRIADEGDIRQTAGKRFAGKRTKEIKSYASQTPLIVEGGESVDFIQASICEDRRTAYGKSGRFGASAQVTPDIKLDDLGSFLDTVVEELARAAQFKLPRTVLVVGEEEIARLDEVLLDELLSKETVSDFTNNTIDLYGVDFVFPSEGTFTLSCGRGAKEQLVQLTMGHLKHFIANKDIARQDILKIQIKHEREGDPSYTSRIKDEIDFIADGERVVLTGGKWLRFNQDYLDFLDDAIRDIEVERVEDEFKIIWQKEGDFNASQAVADAGFVSADKDFELFQTRSPTPVEAWDLRRDTTVYAVKFGTAQKLHYVCDQALNVLELLRNKAETKQVDSFDRYCLWFGYRAKTTPSSLADTGSIILKQKVEAWARKANELGITPVLRISQRVGEVDVARGETS